MIIDLQNCDLEVHYIGTREQIQLQIAIDTARTFLESYTTFGKTVSEAMEAISDAYYHVGSRGREYPRL